MLGCYSCLPFFLKFLGGFHSKLFSSIFVFDFDFFFKKNKKNFGILYVYEQKFIIINLSMICT
jgi:hypothetical protein